MQSIDKPAHYVAKNGLEAIQVIEAFGLNFNLGNVLKYVLRAGKKEDRKQDLEKAMWYLQREIQEELKNSSKEHMDELLKYIFGTK